jgi:hypothetical protein
VPVSEEENQKRKKRAARFATGSATTEEDAKRKAREARFKATEK